MKILNKKQSGFTLVELVVVVAVIGVLAVIAAPKIVGVASDAREASLSAVASSMTAAMARNYAEREATGEGSVITKCSNVTLLLEGIALPNGYAFSDYMNSTAGVPDASETAGQFATHNGATTDGDVLLAAGEQNKCMISTTSTPKTQKEFYGIGIL
jgi:prepilin-type N-terminal cleavage/methylation domain-containing protein